jgi:hypothetical protein
MHPRSLEDHRPHELVHQPGGLNDDITNTIKKTLTIVSIAQYKLETKEDH